MRNRTYNLVKWATKNKNALNVRYSEYGPAGSENVVTTTINRYEYDGELETSQETAIFKDVLQQWTLAQIDENTDKLEREREEKKEKDQKLREQQEEYLRIRKVFETKVDIFNIPDISNSKDREMKSKIRRSKNSVEAIVNAVMLLMKEKDNDISED